MCMNLIFKNHKDNIKLSELNNAYGDFGRTFETKPYATEYKNSLKHGGFVTKLIEYGSRDIVTTAASGTAVAGAVPYTIGWLVTVIQGDDISMRKRSY